MKKESPAARLQTLFKRKQQQDAIIPELIVKQDEERKQDAINTLSDVFKRKKQQEGIIPELIAKQQQEQNAAKILQAAIRRKPMRDVIVSDLPVEREHNIKQKEYAELLQKQKKENEEKLKLGIVRYNQQYKMDSIKWIN